MLEEFMKEKREVQEDTILDDDALSGRVYKRRIQWAEKLGDSVEDTCMKVMTGATAERPLKDIMTAFDQPPCSEWQVLLQIDMHRSVLVELCLVLDNSHTGAEGSLYIEKTAKELYDAGVLKHPPHIHDGEGSFLRGA